MKTPAIAMGIYRVRLGADGRLRLPADWRPLFAATRAPAILLASPEGDRVTVVPGLRAGKFTRAAKALAKNPFPADAPGGELAVAAREALAGATPVRIGSDGRLTIPRALRKKIRLANEVVLAGRLDAAEIWPAKGWPEQEARRQRAAVRALDHIWGMTDECSSVHQEPRR